MHKYALDRAGVPNGVRAVPLIIEKAVKSAPKGGVLKSRKSRSVTLKQLAEVKRRKGVGLTLRHLAAKLSEEHELTKREGEAILGELVSLITKHLKKGNRVRIAGFGILQVRTRAARMGRNPATGELMKIKSSKEIAFRPSSELKVG